MQLRKRWVFPEPRWEQQRLLIKRFNISPLISQVLLNRGLTEPDDVENFLYPSMDKLAPPAAIPAMAQAVQTVTAAMNCGGKVLVYGDYDVDGITGTALLVSVMTSLGLDVDYYIPDRMEEGYGLNEEAVLWAKEQGFGLIVTVDCGINANAEVDLANQLDIQIIITDHHQPPQKLPAAAAVVNPKLGGETSCRDLAGVGVAFKFAQALAEDYFCCSGQRLLLEDTLELVTLGTVADMVPLLGDNRIIVKHGLEQMPYSTRPGIQALLKVAGLAGKEINSGHVGFVLAPRLNAVGRLGNASLGVELLSTHSMQRAEELAYLLDHENNERQTIEKYIFEEVLNQIEQQVNLEKERVIVLASPLWHSGVIGIAASRVVEKFHRPTVLIALEGDTGKASARSIIGFNLYRALEECREFLERFGGHSAAAGFSIKKDNIDGFRKAINDLARQWLTEEQLQPTLKLDCEIMLSQVDENLVEQLEMLKPHGFGNPGPVFCCRGVNLIDRAWVGRDRQHAKMTFASGNVHFPAIGFNIRAADFLESSEVDLAFVPEKNYWQGTVAIQLNVKDMRRAISNSTAATADFGPAFGRVRQQIHDALQANAIAANLALDYPWRRDWTALEAAVTLARNQPVVVVSPLASQSRQLAHAAPLFGQDVEFILADALTIDTGKSFVSGIKKGKVVFLSRQAFIHFRQQLPENTAVLLLNLQGKDIIGLGNRTCYTVDTVGSLENLAGEGGNKPNVKTFQGKADIFTELYGDGHPGIVFTSLPSDTEKIATVLKSNVPGEVMFYNERLKLTEKLQVVNGFSRGLYQVLVTTHGLPLLFDFPLRVVLLDPPFNRGDFCRMLPGEGEVYCHFNYQSWSKQERLLEQLFLKRETLLLTYNTLKRLEENHRPVTVAVIGKTLRKKKIITPGLLETALTVLTELGLIEKQLKEWKVLPVSGKKDLSANWRYCEGMAEFRAFDELRQFFMAQFQEEII